MLREFLSNTLLKCTVGSIYISSLANGRGEGERSLLTRDLDKIEEFAAQWDRAGRGLFFCVSTILEGKDRKKENYGQSAFLHADVDFKDVDCTPEEAEIAVLGLKPTWLTKSGNGLHAYWPLDEQTSDLAAVEVQLKGLCSLVGGDPSVAHVVALMRLPGSHNTKNGSWSDVVMSRHDGGPVPDFTRAPVIARKGAETNPFIRAGEMFGYKPPIDVEARLAAMKHKGPGDEAVHQTQLQCTASRMANGMDIEDVVQEVLEATKKIGDETWNWEKEETVIRGMCEDWLKKHPRVEAAVVSLAAKRADRKLKKSSLHEVIGAGILTAVIGAGQQLLITPKGAWLYSGLWQELDGWKHWVALRVHDGCLALKVPMTNRLVTETKIWLESNRAVSKEADDLPWDDHKKIAIRRGLLDFHTLTVELYKPEHYATHCVDADYLPSAACPLWLQLLTDALLDEATQQTLQEILGAALIDDRPAGLRKALVLVGGSNSGKSTILHVMAGLLSDRPITTDLDTVDSAHGLQGFLRRAPWLLDEAFDQSKWHASAKVKSLLAGEVVGVNVKNGPFVTHAWRGAAMWGTNVPPQFQEASRAMESRLLIIQCQAHFDRSSPMGVAKLARDMGYSSPAELILAKERDGLLAWAVEGLRRSWDRGYIQMTEESRSSLQEMWLESNAAARFFDECVEFDPDSMVSAPDLYAAFFAWWSENSDRKVPSPKIFGTAIFSLNSQGKIALSTDLRHKMIRQRAGIKLNGAGLDYWQAQFQSTAVRGGNSDRISSSVDLVNAPIPGEWGAKPEVRRMRKNQAK